MDSLEELKTIIQPVGQFVREDKARFELVYEVSKKIGSVPRMTQMLEQVIKMTQQTLNAAAASVLLYGDNENELFFEVASGPVGQELRKLKVSSEKGIAGQVARTGRPLIVNSVSNDPYFERNVDEATGFITRSLVCVPLMVQRRIMGVMEVLNKLDGSDFDERDLEAVVSVAATAAMAIENTRLHETVLDAYKSTIMTLAETIDAKHPYTRGHSQRVKEYALLGGASLSLTPEEIETLEYAATLHDIGKIAIDASILNKPGALSESELNIIREHPVIGATLLKKIQFLEKAGDLVLYHHERYDGKGYPAGLKGERIPLGARIIAVADAFDTMTTNRSYRPAMTVDQAFSEIYGCSGTQFCPTAIAAFISGFNVYDIKQSFGHLKI